MMPEEAAAILRDHNSWRRSGDPKMVDPTLLGRAMEVAIAALEASAKPVAWRWLLMDGQPDSDKCFPGAGPSADVAERARNNKGVYLPRVPQLLFAGPQPAFCCCKCGMPDWKTPATANQMQGGA